MENIGEHICDLGLAKNVLHNIIKAQVLKEKIDKFDFIKSKLLCFKKDTIKKTKRKASD